MATKNKPSVLLVSAESTKHTVDEAIKKGASGFVVKPITAANLLAWVANCCPPWRPHEPHLYPDPVLP